MENTPTLDIRPELLPCLRLDLAEAQKTLAQFAEAQRIAEAIEAKQKRVDKLEAMLTKVIEIAERQGMDVTKAKALLQ